jgi:hypothetical protein
MKPSVYILILFLPWFYKCQLRRLDSIQFLCSKAHIPPGWHAETRLTLLSWTLLNNHFARTTQETQPLYCWEGVFTAPMHSNGSYSIVSCVFVAAVMCLMSCCLAMNVYSDFTIPVFWHHVTILIKSYFMREVWNNVNIKIFGKKACMFSKLILNYAISSATNLSLEMRPRYERPRYELHEFRYSKLLAICNHNRFKWSQTVRHCNICITSKLFITLRIRASEWFDPEWGGWLIGDPPLLVQVGTLQRSCGLSATYTTALSISNLLLQSKSTL